MNKNEKIKYNSYVNKLNPIIENNFFKIYYLKINSKEIQKIYMNKSFWIIVCLEGSISMNYKNKEYFLEKGKTMLIPAIMKLVNIRGFGEVIGITI